MTPPWRPRPRRRTRRRSGAWNDALWAESRPRLVLEQPRKKPGPIWSARTGGQGATLPRRCGAKSPVRARFRAWVEHGCLARAWARLLAVYDDEVALDWRWQAADGCIVKAPLGKRGAGAAEATVANPTDRGRCGVKRHLLTDGTSVPLATVLSGANRTEMKQLADLLDAVIYEVPSFGERQLCLDRGYDYTNCRETAVAHGYFPHIPPKRSTAHPLPAPDHPDCHPPRRWVVEMAHRWFNRFRRLLIRWEKRAQNSLGFVQLVAIPIIYCKLRHARTLPG